MLKRIKAKMCILTPKIHNLPQVIYISWLGMEWFIPKY